MKHALTRSILVVVGLLVLAAPAAAGGWATVRLDEAPSAVVAGEPWQFGFLVKQHDRTPTNDVEPVARAVHMATGEVLTAEGEQTGAVGHFSAEVTFPIAGDWKWEIAPNPYAPTSMETLTVLSSAAEEQPAIAGFDRTASVTLGVLQIPFTMGIAVIAPDAAPTTRGGEMVEVVITDSGYTPSRLEISPGTEVVWSNLSVMAHDVGSDNLGFRDSGLLDAGDEFRQRFTTAGTFHYNCGPHPNMTGTIVVVE
ncbi:MAG: cupredoxin domain-containing protein [Chloroflexota bacterium]|nr:cupredoxin domain-containing protein [Chloroflexota bacterium]